jgi:outer membrane protein assembly factor BamB
VGTHENDQIVSLPEGTTRVYPGGEGGVETPMAFADGTVYVSVIDMYADYTPSSSTDEDVFKATGELVAIQADNGKILWDKNLDTMNIGAATVVNDLVFTATLSGKIYAFKRHDGGQVWTYQSSPGVNGWSAVSGDTIVFLAGQNDKPHLVAFKLGN